jgi:hypothetical protein
VISFCAIIWIFQVISFCAIICHFYFCDGLELPEPVFDMGWPGHLSFSSGFTGESACNSEAAVNPSSQN